MALAEECPHEAPKNNFLFDSRYQLTVPADLGPSCRWRTGERLCRLDTNPEIGFLLHCIPATGLQLVGGGGEFSGAGPGDPSAFYSIQLSGVGSRAEAVREAPVRKAGNQEDSIRSKVKVGSLFPKVCSGVGEAEQ